MKVGIHKKEGRLILVWNDGKRRTMAIGLPDSKPARSVAKKIAGDIELDFAAGTGYYDRTLLKYKPRTLGKTATEIPAPELFDRFTKDHAKTNGLALSSVNSRYIPVRKMMEKYLDVPAKSIGKPQAERFADACGKTLQPDTSKARISLLATCWDFSRGLVGGTKTKQSRTIYLSPSLVAMFARRKEAQQPKLSDLVFTTPTGLPIDDRNFRRRAWMKVLKAAKVTYRKPYTNRSTAISHALADGQDYISVAKAAGHSPQVLHDHYANVIKKRCVFVDFD